MQRAVQCGAKVIGVNNRNLHTFNVDPESTEVKKLPLVCCFLLTTQELRKETSCYETNIQHVQRAMEGVKIPNDVIVAALSGIKQRCTSCVDTLLSFLT